MPLWQLISLNENHVTSFIKLQTNIIGPDECRYYSLIGSKYIIFIVIIMFVRVTEMYVYSKVKRNENTQADGIRYFEKYIKLTRSRP